VNIGRELANIGPYSCGHMKKLNRRVSNIIQEQRNNKMYKQPCHG